MVLWSTIITTGLGLLSTISMASGSPIEKRAGTAYNYWQTKAWGANLGNWLVLERWMDPSIFTKYAPDAQDEWSFCKQAANPTKALQDHWNSWVTEDDFKRLQEINANHVRIPVGYWAFIQPDAGEPYVTTGQKQQLERILGYCDKYSLYAIIDLHGLPGSQNGEMHSGHTTNIEFYSSYNIQRSLKTVQAVVDWMNGLDNKLKNRISAIESANEPRVNGSNQFQILKDYYQKAYNIIASSAFKVPMMFHDGFQGLDAWKGFLTSQNAVIDLHPYYAFPPNRNQGSIVKGICNSKTSTASFHLPVFFGEWSLASGVQGDDPWYRKMMDTQISVYKGSGAGGTFWSLKNKINSREWSLQQLQNEGIVNSGTFSYHTNAQC